MGKSTVAGLVIALLPLSLAPRLAAQGYPNTRPGVAYVGSRACAACHAKIYQDYSKTAMGRSMQFASSSLERESAAFKATVFSEKLNRHYDVYRQGSDLFQADYELDASGHEVFRTTQKLEYVIGSGVNGFTYVVRRNDYLFEAPLSYYARKKAWDLSPGYESADHGFSRPIAAACIVCHSGQPQPVRDRDGLFLNPPFRELAIGCENCHGPGAVHIAENTSGHTSENAHAIVNPAKLPARLAEDICMNCHQGGDTRVLVPGKFYSDFRPGTPLRETLGILRVPPKPDDPRETDLLEHHFSMQLSKCFRASNGRLSCLTCHQIHSVPQAGEAAAYYRSRCLRCHSDASCRLPKPKRLERGDDCTGCHMPKRSVELISHSALTNHRIVARPGESLPDEAFHQTTVDLPDLVWLNRPHDPGHGPLPLIMLLQAYGELMVRYPAYAPRYFAVLDNLNKSATDQPLVRAALGQKAFIEKSFDSAIDQLTRAIDLGFTSPAVFQNLAEALNQSGREPDAAAVLQRGIDLSPYTPALYKFLTLRYIHLKRFADAKNTLDRYVELFPEDDFMRGLLLKVQHSNAPAAP